MRHAAGRTSPSLGGPRTCARAGKQVPPAEERSLLQKLLHLPTRGHSKRVVSPSRQLVLYFNSPRYKQAELHHTRLSAAVQWTVGQFSSFMPRAQLPRRPHSRTLLVASGTAGTTGPGSAATVPQWPRPAGATQCQQRAGTSESRMTSNYPGMALQSAPHGPHHPGSCQAAGSSEEIGARRSPVGLIQPDMPVAWP